MSAGRPSDVEHEHARRRVRRALPRCQPVHDDDVGPASSRRPPRVSRSSRRGRRRPGRPAGPGPLPAERQVAPVHRPPIASRTAPPVRGPRRTAEATRSARRAENGGRAPGGDRRSRRPGYRTSAARGRPPPRRPSRPPRSRPTPAMPRSGPPRRIPAPASRSAPRVPRCDVLAGEGATTVTAAPAGSRTAPCGPPPVRRRPPRPADRPRRAAAEAPHLPHRRVAGSDGHGSDAFQPASEAPQVDEPGHEEAHRVEGDERQYAAVPSVQVRNDCRNARLTSTPPNAPIAAGDADQRAGSRCDFAIETVGIGRR